MARSNRKGGGKDVSKDGGKGASTGKGADGRAPRVRRAARLVLFGAALASATGLVWLGLYGWAGGRLDRVIAEALLQAEHRGLEVAYGSYRRGGFPRSVRRAYGEVEARGANGFYMQSPEVAVEFFLADPRRAELRWAGLVVRGLTPEPLERAGGEARLQPVEWSTGTARVLFRRRLSGEAESVTWEAEKLRFLRADGPLLEAASLRAEARVPQGPATEGAEGGTAGGPAGEGGEPVAFSFAFEELVARLPAEEQGAAGERRDLGDVRVAGRIFGPLSGAGGLGARFALAAWRDQGGYLELDELRFASGPATIAATGALALDGAGRPEGAGRFIFSGGGELSAELALPPEQQAVLSALAAANGAGPGEEIRLDLSWRIQEGLLFVEGIPFYRFNPLF